jgi:hypothetical protein
VAVPGLGVLWLLIAWLVLRLNATSLTTVGILLGVVFVLAAINEVGVATLSHGGWKVWHWILAVIFLLGGCTALSGRSAPSSRWPRCWG